ncbi:GtrA family protein [Polynucleobacter paneuropaeus]|nr:GtrA family protein [Polynucleobacter paneuropaeus]
MCIVGKLIIIKNQKLRYFIVGIANTIFGYTLSLILYKNLRNEINLLSILIFGNIIAITEAYIAYKIFVFKTKGNWLYEYIKSYLVYGSSAIIGISLTFFLVNGIELPFWIAQAISILLCVIFSFIANSKFTFREKNKFTN